MFNAFLRCAGQRVPSQRECAFDSVVSLEHTSESLGGLVTPGIAGSHTPELLNLHF